MVALSVGRSSWRTLPRRAVMHSKHGRRLWWQVRRRSELEFWQGWLTGASGTEQWAADRDARLDPDAEIRDPVLRHELECSPRDDVAILDVGAGPITSVGYRCGGKRVTVVPVDPLADEYRRLLRDAGLEPPVPTIRVAGEDLVRHFGRKSFDIAYAVNSLDHSADPVAIISNMVEVVRAGGIVLLRHKRNEGESARYGGLHQSNFDVADGRLVVWNTAARIDVTSALADRAETTAWLARHEVVARLVVKPSS